jgi:DNA transformation protein
MNKHNEFIEFLNETFEEFGLVDSVKMFGGYGIYHDGIMFGLVENDTLYLKADETTRELFESKGLAQFQYSRAGKVVKMSYYRAPDEIYDDRDKAAVWASRAYEAALRQSINKIEEKK